MKVIKTDDARVSIKKAVNFVGDLVDSTLGPYGTQVLIDRQYQDPLNANDGGTVMDAIEVEDEIENTVVKYMRGATREMTKVVGEGRSTCVHLTRALYNRLSDLLEEDPLSNRSMELRLKVQQSLTKVLKQLDKAKKPVEKDEQIKYIASSACESKELGGIIAEAVLKVGPTGVVSTQEAEGSESSFEVTQGLEIQKGMAFPSMMTDFNRRRADYRKVPVMVTEAPVKNFNQILPLIQTLSARGTKGLVLVADDFQGDTVQKLVEIRMKLGFGVLCVVTPGFGDKGKEEIEDLAVIVGANVRDKIEGTIPDDLGYADRVLATLDTTTFSGGNGTKDEVKERVNLLSDQLEGHDNREWVEGRIAQLSEGVGVVLVGAPTKAERDYLRLKAEDAINATKAAIEDGVVPGGGKALADIDETLSDDDVLKGVLRSPFEHIQTSAGKSFKVPSHVIDPVKVEKEALRIACSIAPTLITSNAVIAIKVEEDKK